MKTVKITLTTEQHDRLKAVLDRALEERPNNLNLQELWHACARAEPSEGPEVAVTPA